MDPKSSPAKPAVVERPLDKKATSNGNDLGGSAKPAVVERPLDKEAASNEYDSGAMISRESETNKPNQQINGLEVSMSNSTPMHILPMRKAKVSSHFTTIC